MVETLLRRWAAAASDVYDLSPSQHEALEGQLLERWPKFLAENRAELQPLLNEYLEARIAARPPSAEAARSWSHRALPQLAKLREFLDATQGEFAALLTAEQREKLSADRSRLAEALGSLETQLERWSGGDYEARQWSELTRPARAQGRTDGTPPRPAPGPADEFEAEIAAWDRFVREFIEKYALDDGQRATAASILAEMEARARAHYHSRSIRIAAMEELIRHPKLGTTAADIEVELKQLYGPIDDMFRELEHRLSLIPTAAQRRRVDEASGK